MDRSRCPKSHPRSRLSARTTGPKGGLAVLVLWLVATLLVAPQAEAIVIRHDVDDSEYLRDEGDFPAVFDVFPGRGGVATLVAPEWAMTVSHVAQSLHPGHRVALLGESYAVREVLVHPDWESDLVEMALIRLDRPVEGVAPIAPYGDQGEVGQTMTFVGRGDTGTGLTGPTTHDGRLRAATNRVERVEGEMLVFRFDAPDDPGVTPLEGISGPGDSGGPAIARTADGPRLAGLSVAQMSAGFSRGTYGVWEFYTRVSAYSPWIDQIIGSEAMPDVGEAAQLRDESRRFSGAGVAAAVAVAYLAGLVVWWMWRRRHR
jgi:hypothetical protein